MNGRAKTAVLEKMAALVVGGGGETCSPIVLCVRFTSAVKQIQEQSLFLDERVQKHRAVILEPFGIQEWLEPRG